MIVLKLHERSELPELYEAPAAHVLRLSFVEAKRAGMPFNFMLQLAFDIGEAVNFLFSYPCPMWAFFTISEAEKWAHEYEGEQAEGVRFVVWDYIVLKNAPPYEMLVLYLYADEEEPEIYFV